MSSSNRHPNDDDDVTTAYMNLHPLHGNLVLEAPYMCMLPNDSLITGTASSYPLKSGH